MFSVADSNMLSNLARSCAAIQLRESKNETGNFMFSGLSDIVNKQTENMPQWMNNYVYEHAHAIVELVINLTD